jgi:hypothetical protein
MKPFQYTPCVPICLSFKILYTPLIPESGNLVKMRSRVWAKKTLVKMSIYCVRFMSLLRQVFKNDNHGPNAVN